MAVVDQSMQHFDDLVVRFCAVFLVMLEQLDGYTSSIYECENAYGILLVCNNRIASFKDLVHV